MLNINIKTVPDNEQRYNTVGDYYTDENGKQQFIISDMNNRKYEFLVLLHELVESSLCTERNITDKQIDDFDFSFEEKRLKNEVTGAPGDSADAPYYNEHQFATKIEKMMAEELGVDWDEYNKMIEKLDSK